MIPAPLPPNEADRLQALRALLILNTPPEERFDRIVAFAAAEFDMPMATISLIDSDRQWFKSRVGMDFCESARSESFCGHAILQGDAMVVNDTLQDPRFVGNPMVDGAPHIRFYAGAPLKLPNGHTVGTICVLSPTPSAMDALDLAILYSLRDLVVEELVRTGGEP